MIASFKDADTADLSEGIPFSGLCLSSAWRVGNCGK